MSCFCQSGGGIASQNIPDSFGTTAELFYHSWTCIPSVGRGTGIDESNNDCTAMDGSELLMFVSNIDLETCLIINKSASIPTYN